jgi:phage terminase small subunit
MQIVFDLLKKPEIKAAIETRKAELMAGKKMTLEK